MSEESGLRITKNGNKKLTALLVAVASVFSSGAGWASGGRAAREELGELRAQLNVWVLAQSDLHARVRNTETETNRMAGMIETLLKLNGQQPPAPAPKVKPSEVKEVVDAGNGFGNP